MKGIEFLQPALRLGRRLRFYLGCRSLCRKGFGVEGALFAELSVEETGQAVPCPAPSTLKGRRDREEDETCDCAARCGPGDGWILEAWDGSFVRRDFAMVCWGLPAAGLSGLGCARPGRASVCDSRDRGEDVSVLVADGIAQLIEQLFEMVG